MSVHRNSGQDQLYGDVDQCCSICLEPFTDGGRRDPRLFTGCGHSFCIACIEGIKSSSSNNNYLCPNCRTPFDTHTNQVTRHISLIQRIGVTSRGASSNTPLSSVASSHDSYGTRQEFSSGEGLLNPFDPNDSTGADSVISCPSALGPALNIAATFCRYSTIECFSRYATVLNSLISLISVLLFSYSTALDNTVLESIMYKYDLSFSVLALSIISCALPTSLF